MTRDKQQTNNHYYTGVCYSDNNYKNDYGESYI